MHAVIHQIAGAELASLLPVAGRPLLVRQIQWLRAIGCERVTVEVDARSVAGRVMEWVEESDGIALFVDVVLTAAPAGAREVARRAGITGPFIAVPCDVLGSADLAPMFPFAADGGAVARLSPPDGMTEVCGGEVALFGKTRAPAAEVAVSGWGVRIASLADALAFGSALLSSATLWAEEDDTSFVPPIHAAERSPGVFVGRGAYISPDAEIVGPAWIGPHAYIAAGARIGPDAFVADHAMVDEGAVVEHAMIFPRVTVARGDRALDEARTSAGSLCLRSSPERASADCLFPRAPATAPSWASRAVAMACVLWLAPWVALFFLAGGAWSSMFRALVEVVRGKRTLVGVGSSAPHTSHASPGLLESAARAPAGVIDIERELVPSAADVATILRARAWYATSKSPAVDRMLVRAALRRAMGRLPRAGAVMTMPPGLTVPPP
jgi:hypothetical protein